AQKISSTGQVQWQENGVKASVLGGLFLRPATDGEGGVIVAWWGKDFKTDYDLVICQRINRRGEKMWGDSGVVVSNRKGIIPSNDVAIASDRTGGAVVSWVQDTIVYIQRIDKDGKTRWTPNGIVISNRGSGLVSQITSQSGDNGMSFVSWYDDSASIYIQKIDREGISYWQKNGLLIAKLPLTGGGGARRILYDGNGGAFLGYGLRVQHLDSTGKKTWVSSGVVFTTLPSTNSNMVSDLNGGIINICEATIKQTSGSNLDIYAQRIDRSGQVSWSVQGIALVDAPFLQRNPKSISDGSGGAIAVWDDLRSAEDTTIPFRVGIYAQRITREGVITSVEKQNAGTIPKSPFLQQSYPNPFNPRTTIEYEIPSQGNVELTIYDTLGKVVRKMIEKEQKAGSYRVVWDGRDGKGNTVASGLYYYQLLFNRNIQLTRKSILLR
ncbi:MAG: FlgD immunoglobulin-like domain containing protein, partial [bacterium]